MKPQPGAELSCRGQNYDFPVGTIVQPRGVVSYYATGAMSSATTMDEWLAGIDAAVAEDVDSGKLPMLYRPELQLIGDGGNCLFGE